VSKTEDRDRPLGLANTSKFSRQQSHCQRLFDVRVVDMQDFAKYVTRGAFVPTVSGTQLSRRKLQHASKLQFA